MRFYARSVARTVVCASGRVPVFMRLLAASDRRVASTARSLPYQRVLRIRTIHSIVQCYPTLKPKGKAGPQPSPPGPILLGHISIVSILSYVILCFVAASPISPDSASRTSPRPTARQPTTTRRPTPTAMCAWLATLHGPGSAAARSLAAPHRARAPWRSSSAAVQAFDSRRPVWPTGALRAR